ncbi:MAG: hypothetical protein CMM47_00865 [Rhodospirillaceae bacterium]|nr:hypothetical protein [Rhodospirillaceae bacterium]
MNRSMWILAALFAVMAIALVYQSEFDSGVERPWNDCKENLLQQMFSNSCTPRTGGVSIQTE